MTTQRRYQSRQDFSTPDIFIEAVKARLGITDFVVDLAADVSNRKATLYLNEEVDALTVDWTQWRGCGWCWLNPPFTDIAPWAEKCSASSPTQIALLVPAAIGSNWWRDHVDGKAHVLPLNGRLSFDGIGPYPKDCALCLYGPIRSGYEVWDWRKQATVLHG